MRSFLSALGLVLVAFGGYLNGVGAIERFVPVNLVIIGSALVAVCFCIELALGRVRLEPLIILALLALSLVPGFILADGTSDYGVTKTFQMSVLIPVCVIGASVLLQEDRRRRALLYAVVAMGAATAAFSFLDPDESYLAYNQVFAEGSNYIAAARSAAACMIVFGVAAINVKKWRFSLSAGAVFFFVIALLTGARGPLVAALVAVGATVVIRGTKRGVVGILISAPVLYLGYLWLSERGLLATRLGSLDDSSVAVRGDLVRETIPVIFANWQGVGWGGLQYEFSNNALLASGTYLYPHNIYLELLAEAGWFAGILFFFAIAVAFVRQLKTQPGPVENAFLALFLFFLFSAALSGDLMSERGVWLLLGACLAAPLTSRSVNDSLPKVAV